MVTSGGEHQVRRLLIATTNEGKVRELRALLDGLNVELLSLGQLAEMPAPVEETGETFAENALLKAEYYFARTGITTLADDSGLEVEALGGRPGVRSARYGGEGLGDAERNSLLLAEMVEVAKGMRGARFVCVLALVDATRRETFEGYCEGAITTAPLGSGGFGYDPIFVAAETGESFATMSSAEKNRHSHRGQALERLRQFLTGLDQGDPGGSAER